VALRCHNPWRVQCRKSVLLWGFRQEMYRFGISFARRARSPEKHAQARFAGSTPNGFSGYARSKTSAGSTTHDPCELLQCFCASAIEGKAVRGKTALVTGSTSGIGWSLATTPAVRGSNIVPNGFAEATAMAETRGRPASFGFAGAAADLRSPPAAVGMITQTTWRFDGVAMGARRQPSMLATCLGRSSPRGRQDAHEAAAVLRLAKVVALETAGRWRLGAAIGMRP